MRTKVKHGSKRGSVCSFSFFEALQENNQRSRFHHLAALNHKEHSPPRLALRARLARHISLRFIRHNEYERLASYTGVKIMIPKMLIYCLSCSHDWQDAHLSLSSWLYRQLPEPLSVAAIPFRFSVVNNAEFFCRAAQSRRRNANALGVRFYFFRR